MQPIFFFNAPLQLSEIFLRHRTRPIADLSRLIALVFKICIQVQRMRDYVSMYLFLNVISDALPLHLCVAAQHNGRGNAATFCPKNSGG